MADKIDRRFKRKERPYLYGVVCEDLEARVRAASRGAISAAEELKMLPAPGAAEKLANDIAKYARQKLADAWRNEVKAEEPAEVNSPFGQHPTEVEL